MNAGRIEVAVVVTRFQAGAGVVALRGALALDPDRFRVTVVAGSGDRLLDDARAAGLGVVLEPSLRSPISPVHDVRALRRLTNLFARNRFDVVHTHSAKAGALGRLAGHRARVPRIVHTFHGLPFHEFQSAPTRQAYLRIERRLGTITDIGLCVGTGVAVDAVRLGVLAPERVRTIGVAVDGAAPMRTPERRDSARRRLGLPVGATVVGAVGRLAFQKAPEDFVAALRRLHRPGVVGVWIGDGELGTRIRALAAAACPHARVVLAGERADVPELLPALDVFALPSRYEGLPVAIVEAMVCGIPVVATAVNSVPDVVVPGETGLLVPPARPELLARAIAHLLDHPADAARMAGAARERVGDHYDATVLGAALTAAYTGTPSVHTSGDREESSCG